MKIIEINGLITLEADAGKVLTTLLPSSLRAEILYLGIYDSADNYIEIDEVPEIELPLYEEPDLEEHHEVLNGLTLTEAYYQLLNENRVLKEENKKQYELIDITMLVTDEMYMKLEPLLAKTLSERGVSRIINMYKAMVQRGIKTLEEVPARYREQVREILERLEN